jgi:hypothetical protein
VQSEIAGHATVRTLDRALSIAHILGVRAVRRKGLADFFHSLFQLDWAAGGRTAFTGGVCLTPPGGYTSMNPS